MTDRRPLKCYHVDGEGCDAEDIEIIFARSSIEAKRRWANEHWDGEIAGVSARREKQWDKFAPGPVPNMELLGAGWSMECHGCSAKIFEEGIGSPVERGEIDDVAEAPERAADILDPYEPRPGAIWCNRACHDRDMLERRRIKTIGTRALRVVKAEVMRRWPGVTLAADDSMRHHHVYATRHSSGWLLVHDVRVRFTVPGMHFGGCELRVDDEKWRYARERRPDPKDSRGYREHPLQLAQRKRAVELLCANGDKDVWEAWVEANKPQEAA